MKAKQILTISMLVGVLFISALPIYGQEASTSSELNSDIQKRVEEKIKNVLEKPKAYMGSITDKTEESLQIQNLDGEIQLLSVDQETVGVVKIVDSKSTEQKYSDVAIGDFLLALGFKNENSVLDTKRILLITKPAQVNRKAYLATIEEITSSSLTIQTKTAQTIDVTTNRFTEFTINVDGELDDSSRSELENGGLIIVSGVEDEDGITARNIHIIQRTSSEN